ncbi:MAG TPA: energy transducer TonB [Steroidobacteraceae bacterium]|nr:energy transducer TonB [Steroidobacteraceae bacterium]
MSGQSLRTDEAGQNADHLPATWDLSVARQLVSHAARKAPPGLTERLEEEWLADLVGRKGAFSRIGFGVGCCWATRVIAREFGAAATAAGSSASGQRLLVGYGGYDFSRFSRRTVAMVAIVCLHAAVFYAYLSGFTQGIVTNPTKWIDLSYIPRQPPTPHVRPALPPPTLTPIVESLPPPNPTFKLSADPAIITVPRTTNVGPVQLPPAKAVQRVIGGPGAGFPDTGDYYPAGPRRLGEAGATVVSVCVDPRGRLTAAPAIVDSSGIGQIDEGALRLARAGSGHYRPTTENGQPVSSCYAFRVRFQLEDQ